MGARGGGSEQKEQVAVGLSGVTAESQSAYEITEAGTFLYTDDYLRITTARYREELGYVFVLGLQRERSPIWYEPDPAEAGLRSVPTPLGAPVPLGGVESPFEFHVKGRHVVGALRVYAIFSAEALLHAEVAAVLDDRSAEMPSAEWLEKQLSAKDTPVVVVSAEASLRAGRKEAH